MADTYTTALNLVKPEVGSSRDTWGAKTNGNWDVLDQFVSMGTPIGAILDFAGPNAPPGWLICDGRLISRVTFSKLFAVIGTAWGAGDGSTTFALPPTSGRSSIGPGTVTDEGGLSYTFTFAHLQGYVWNRILQANLPNYNLVTDVQGYHYHSGATNGSGGHQHTTDAQGNHNHGGITWGASANHTHSGTTDTQGNHQHNVNAFGAVGGPNAVAPGGIATGNAIQTDFQGLHAHNFTTGIQSADHTHIINTDGNHAHTTTYIGDHIHGIYGDGNHQHNVSLGGGGTVFEVMSPIIVVTKIIYAGQQAGALVVGVASLRVEDRDELADLRAELAQLRAQMDAVFAPARRRMLAAPLRGPH
jgi:microcystin-dependent protein